MLPCMVGVKLAFHFFTGDFSWFDLWVRALPGGLSGSLSRPANSGGKALRSSAAHLLSFAALPSFPCRRSLPVLMWGHTSNQRQASTITKFTNRDSDSFYCSCTKRYLD